MRQLVLRGVDSSEELTEAQVAASAADPAELPALLALAAHPDEGVRWALVAVLWALPDGDDGGPLPAVLDTAVALSGDREPRIRDWACFTLGQQWSDVDTPALREALVARLTDTHEGTRGEALLGLALRRDARALPAVRTALLGARPSALELQAAGAVGDPELHPLVALHQDGWDDEDDRATAGAALRLTDPAGLGDDVLDGVAELYRRRAHEEGDGGALASWELLRRALELAPHRAAEAMAEVESRLLDDPAALAELHERSALAVEVGLAGGS